MSQAIQVSILTGETKETQTIKLLVRKVSTVDTNHLVAARTIGKTTTTITITITMTEQEAPTSTKTKVALLVRPKAERIQLVDGRVRDTVNMEITSQKVLITNKILT